MKFWKINSVSSEPVKVAVITSSTSSRGMVLQPNEFCIAKPQMTSVIDAQRRRGLISIDESFDNSELNLELGIPISESFLEEAKMSKLEQAKKDAKEYVEKK